MVTLAMTHVAVWLDLLAPERGAFAHGLEWAQRLHLPLRAFAPAAIESAAVAAQEPKYGPNGPACALADSTISLASARLRVCEAACDQRGVHWEAVLWQGPPGPGIERFLRSAGLCVFAEALPSLMRPDLLLRSLHRGQMPVLVCPRFWRPVSRVLVVNDQQGLERCYLDIVAQVCRAFGATPVVLTVARTEREAKLRQQGVEATFAGCHVAADFDSVVGSDVATAVAGVARWRRCSHVFVEVREPGPWWRRLWGDPLEQLVGLAESVAVLAIPANPRPSRADKTSDAGGQSGDGTGVIARASVPRNVCNRAIPPLTS
jgi:hypothetical protein